ncbi:MAG: radical SAM family heme chaperone HemW, partial [Planctomycetota bacterium]
HYCDFYSLVDTRDRQPAFTARLIRELEAIAPLASGEPLSTIFVGGGTPTLLERTHWQTLLAAMHSSFDMTDMGQGSGEFTVECNPETADAELFDTLVEGGVNRLSIGAQSFDKRHLHTLQRWHDPDTVPRAIELARAAGIERISIDLIFAIPGQTTAEWENDLDRALGLGIDHVSCYALTYEPNTVMTARMERGEFQPADDDIEADMYELTVAKLAAAGLDRYEVSNFAKPGEACRHNLAYWRHESWLAAGPSASGHLLSAQGGSWRYKIVPRIGNYLEGDGVSAVTDLEPPEAGRLAIERVMTGLRLSEGVRRDAIIADAEAASPGATSRVERAERPHIDAGRLDVVEAEEGSRWRLTEAGYLFADGIASDLMAAFI